MATLSLQLTGFDVSNPIPGVYAEVRVAQGVQAGDFSEKKALIMAPKTSAGAITADTQVVGPIGDEADVVRWAGAGSPAHAMYRAFRGVNVNAPVYLVCPAAASGTTGADKITVTGTPTGAGTVGVFICGELIEVSYTTSSTATTIGDDLVLAINARTHLPVTAANSSGVVTISTKIQDEVFNTIRYRSYVTVGTGMTVVPTADTQIGLSGQSSVATPDGTVSYANSLVAIAGRKFDYIIPHVSCSYDSSGAATPGTAAAIDALVDQVVSQADPSTGFRQKVIAGACLSPANAATMAAASNLNRSRAQLVNQEESPEPSYVLAAKMCAVRMRHEVSDPSYNFDGYGTKEGNATPFGRPFNDSAIPTTAELKVMLNGGVTPIGVATNNAGYIVRSVSTYHLAGSGILDYRARDTTILTTADKFTDDLVVRLATAPWTHITDDPPDGAREPPAKFATPRRVRTVTESLIRDYADAGWLDPSKVDALIAAIQVGIDPSLASRMNQSVPIMAAVPLHQHALLVKETSPAY